LEECDRENFQGCLERYVDDSCHQVLADYEIIASFIDENIQDCLGFYVDDPCHQVLADYEIIASFIDENIQDCLEYYVDDPCHQVLGTMKSLPVSSMKTFETVSNVMSMTHVIKY
ncbi:hypothetical protein AVEN_187960-2-1, partial [Araneus ventricosus]